MTKPYIDKLMGGRIRDRETTIPGGGSNPADLKTYIEELIANSTINWSQIIGSPTTNTELKQYIDSLLELIALNQFNALELITQDMKNYFATLLQNLTITTDQITDLDSINTEFKTYIDGQIAALTNYVNQLVLGDAYTAELKQYIDTAISNLQTVLESLIQTTVNTEVAQYIEQIINSTSEATRLISGSVTWIQNLDFLVSPLVYQILNNRVESPETLVTIPANAENNPRFAVIYGDIFGNVGYVLGVAAPSPAVPLIDDATQINLTTVYIAALGTSPSPDPGGQTDTIVNTVIYDENIEWTAAKTEEAGITIDLADVSEPAHGAKAIKMVIVGGAASTLKSALVSSAAVSAPTLQTYPDTLPDTEIIVLTADLYPDQKTDFTVDGIRHLVYYRANTRNSITFTNHLNDIPAGDYTLIISGITRYDQQYIVTSAANITPAAAKISFTTLVPELVEGGNISLSLKTSSAWLSNTGLLIELYNGAEKVGSLPVIPGSLRGFNPDQTFDYQRIALPVSDFNPTGSLIDKLIIRPVNAWPNGYFLIDNIVLQTGIIGVKEIDKYVESAALDANGILTLKRSAGLPDLPVQFAKVAKTGSYNDLGDKPVIPAAQQQSDWNAANGITAIANKPAIPAVGSIAIKDYWTGTAANYAAIAPKLANTIYFVEE